MYIILLIHVLSIKPGMVYTSELFCLLKNILKIEFTTLAYKGKNHMRISKDSGKH